MRAIMNVISKREKALGVRFVKKTLILLSMAASVLVGVFWFVGMSSRTDGTFIFNSQKPSQPTNPVVSINGELAEKWEESLAANSVPKKTNEISAQIAEYFVESTQASGDIKRENTQEFVDSLLEEVSKKTEPVRYYALSDLAISSEESPNARLAYDNEMVESFKTHTYPELGNEVALFLETTRASAIYADFVRVRAALTKAESAYQAIAETLTEVKTPRSQSARHLKVVNAFVKLSSSVREMKHGIGDPMGGIAGVGMYLETARGLLELQK